MKIPYFFITIFGYLTLITLILPFRLSEKYLTPDENAYTDNSLIERSESNGFSFNSSNGKLGARYLVAALYFGKTYDIGGRPLIFAINITIVIWVFYIFWRSTRTEKHENLNLFFAFSLLTPSVIFFSASALRDIFVYAINVYLLYRIGCKNGPISTGTLIAAVAYLFISPYFGTISIFSFVISRYCKNIHRSAAILYILTLLASIFIFTYLHKTNHPIDALKNWPSLPSGVLGEETASEPNANSEIILANLSMVLAPYLLPRNIAGTLDWLFFIQSVVMISLLPLFLRNTINRFHRIWSDTRLRFSLMNFLLLYPLFFRETDSSSLIRHSLAIMPFYLYILFGTKRRSTAPRFQQLKT